MSTNGSKERTVYALRLHNVERRVLEAAAAQRAEHLSEFVRRSALQAARAELAQEPDTPARSGLNNPPRPGADASSDTTTASRHPA